MPQVTRLVSIPLKEGWGQCPRQQGDGVGEGGLGSQGTNSNVRLHSVRWLSETNDEVSAPRNKGCLYTAGCEVAQMTKGWGGGERRQGSGGWAKETKGKVRPFAVGRCGQCLFR